MTKGKMTVTKMPTASIICFTKTPALINKITKYSAKEEETKKIPLLELQKWPYAKQNKKAALI